MMEDRFRKRLRKKARKGLRGWPIATVAFYGPNLSQATKVTVGIVPFENAEVKELRDWKVDRGDIRADPGVAKEMLDKFKHLLGDTGGGTDVAAIHLPVAQLFHLCVLGWHDANGDLRRLAEVWTIECNRRNRPTSQSLPGFLAQALEEPIFLHIAPSATLPFTIGCRVALPYSITSSARPSSEIGGPRQTAYAGRRVDAPLETPGKPEHRVQASAGQSFLLD